MSVGSLVTLYSCSIATANVSWRFAHLAPLKHSHSQDVQGWTVNVSWEQSECQLRGLLTLSQCAEHGHVFHCLLQGYYRGAEACLHMDRLDEALELNKKAQSYCSQSDEGLQMDILKQKQKIIAGKNQAAFCSHHSILLSAPLKLRACRSVVCVTSRSAALGILVQQLFMRLLVWKENCNALRKWGGLMWVSLKQLREQCCHPVLCDLKWMLCIVLYLSGNG